MRAPDTKIVQQECIRKLLGVIEVNIADADVFYTSSGTRPFYEN